MKVKFFDDNDKEIEGEVVFQKIKNDHEHFYIISVVIDDDSITEISERLIAIDKIMRENNITNFILMRVRNKDEKLIINEIKTQERIDEINND